MLKKISFKNMVVASSYYAIGGIRFYDKEDQLIPILFSVKNQLLTNRFTGGLTGTVDTLDSYGIFYFVESSFDTTKPQIGSYTQYAYWLSGSANELSITFDEEVDNISRVEYVPKIDEYSSNRHLLGLTIELTDKDGEVIYSEEIDTSSAEVNEIRNINISDYLFPEKILLKSNNKIYSLKSEEILHETKMTSNTAPAPLVASASSIYNTTYSEWKAFNGSNVDGNDAWVSQNGKVVGEWIQIDFGTKMKSNKVTIQERHTSNKTYAMKDFEIMGSKDGVVFKTIKRIQNESPWNSQEKREFEFKTSLYRYYRIKVINNHGGSYVHIGDILFSYKGGFYEIPSDSLNNFIEYGINSMKNLDSVNTDKIYVLQKDVSQNEQGLWVKRLTQKPLSINFE